MIFGIIRTNKNGTHGGLVFKAGTVDVLGFNSYSLAYKYAQIAYDHFYIQALIVEVDEEWEKNREAKKDLPVKKVSPENQKKEKLIVKEDKSVEQQEKDIKEIRKNNGKKSQDKV